MKPCMPRLITWKHRWNRRLEDPHIPRSMPPIPWRCELVVKLADGMMFFLGGRGRGGWMMRSPNFATRSFVTLKGFLLLGGFLALDGLTSTFQEKLFKDRAIWHGIHLLFLQTSSVDFQTCHLGCLLFNIGLFQYFSYEFGLVSHIQSLFQQLLLDFWDQTIIEGAPHHQVQSDDVHQPSVSWLQKSQQWFKVKLLTVRNWSAVSSLLLNTDVLF